MSRWSDRQFSETGSGWFGARMGERNFPPNIRVVGDSTKLAYSCPYIFYQCQAEYREMELLAHYETLTYHLRVSLTCLRRLGFFYIKCRTDRLLTREYRGKLVVKSVKV